MQQQWQWQPHGLELVVLVGLQASGKSTFRGHHLGGYVPLSKDDWPNARNKAARQARTVDEALAAGQAVVGNTNVSADERRPLVEAARAYDALAIAVVFDSSVAECLARNARREGRERVPDVAIFATAKRWQRPTGDEGFVRRFRAAVADDGTFSVTPTTDPTAEP